MKCSAFVLIPALAVVMPTSASVAQEASLKTAIVGTWVLTKNINKRDNGNVTDPFGKGVGGHFVYSPDGAYTQVIIGEKKPDMKSEDPRRPDAFLITNIGTYTVDPDNKTIHIKVTRAGNSIREGNENTDTVVIKGDTAVVTGGMRRDKDGSFSPIQELRRFSAK